MPKNPGKCIFKIWKCIFKNAYVSVAPPLNAYYNAYRDHACPLNIQHSRSYLLTTIPKPPCNQWTKKASRDSMLALLAFSSDVILYIYVYIYGPTTLVSSHYIAWSEFIVIYTIFLYMYIILLQSLFAPVPANPRPQGPWLHDWIQHQWHVGDPKVICILSRGGKTYSKNMHFAICIFQNLLWGENMHFS